MGRPASDDSLPIELFYDLYLGALDLDDEDDRLAAIHVVLGIGRLGLRPDELAHLHEGWIDWRRGEIRIPAYEPCACRRCWAEARRRADGERSVETVLTEERWSPTPGGARTVPFGWSGRIGAALARFFDERDYLDRTPEEMRELLERAATNAESIDPADLTPSTLRRTAARFFADAGLDAEALAATLGIGRDQAETYARIAGTRSTHEVYQALGAGPPPVSPDDPGSTFPIACDPTPFEREPFAPREFDAAARAERADEREDDRRPIRNPRPVVAPEGGTYDPTDHELGRHRDPESEQFPIPEDGLAPAESTMPAWMEAREAERGVDHRTAGEAGDDGEDGIDVGMLSSIAADCIAHFATTDGPSRPVEGRFVLGQEELLLVAEGDLGEVRRERIPLDSIFDVSLDYVPTGMGDVFYDPVSIAYREDSEKKIALVEPDAEASADVREIATALYEALLRGETVTVRHPARIGGRVTDETTRQMELHPASPRLVFQGPDAAFDLELGEVFHLETVERDMGGDRMRVLSVTHDAGRTSKTTEIATGDGRLSKLLRRYVRLEYDRKREAIREFDLDEEEKEVLVALYSTGGGMDLTNVLTKDAEHLAELLDSLEKKGLIDREDGTRLTDNGEVLLAEHLDEASA